MYHVRNYNTICAPPPRFKFKCTACTAHAWRPACAFSATSTWMHSAVGRACLNPCRAALFVAVFALAVLCDIASAFFSPPVRLLTTTNIMSSSSSISGNSGAVSAESGATKQLPSLTATVKGILFDMDGTLTDSDTLHFEAYRETFLKVRVSTAVHTFAIQHVQLSGRVTGPTRPQHSRKHRHFAPSRVLQMSSW